MEVVQLTEKLAQLQEDFDLFVRQINDRLMRISNIMNTQDSQNRGIIDSQVKQINGLLEEVAALKRQVGDLEELNPRKNQR